MSTDPGGTGTGAGVPAPVTAAPYPLAFEHLGRGRFADLLTADVRLGLVTGGYTPGAADRWWATPAAHQTTGAGYVAGGVVLPHASFDLDSAGRAALSCDPVVFTAAGFTARWAVVYVNTGDPGTSPLLSYVDFGADVSPAGADLQLTFPAAVFRIGPAGG